jgi:rSAM/selenodomain-associated transferase 1
VSRIDPASVALVVIAKEPLPGRAKTRLSPPLTPEGASQLAAACLADTLAAVVATPAHRHVLVLEGSPDDAWMPPAGAGPTLEVHAQRDGGLGESLAGAFADPGAAPALLVGMDTPQITPELLTTGIETLAAEGVDAVLGPAEDGGYWSIGLRAADERVFDGVPMSADDTGARQLRRLHDLGLETVELEPLLDIDTIADARAVAATAPATRCAATLAELDTGAA